MLLARFGEKLHSAIDQPHPPWPDANSPSVTLLPHEKRTAVLMPGLNPTRGYCPWRYMGFERGIKSATAVRCPAGAGHAQLSGGGYGHDSRVQRGDGLCALRSGWLDLGPLRSLDPQNWDPPS
jgi:hypothetical protein